jgi:hypothetical protein
MSDGLSGYNFTWFAFSFPGLGTNALRLVTQLYI